ncbi:hypothetical protein SAMN06265360_106149 [Haloechinothrix alba]|uniref:Uncharacterized protein n=1 Tax=Haloechinothrix alba TaxID=664784 RepID=A0A238WGT4_9PSEU|nr:hypothetical protein [Haloechinothrix alba]SNR45648.1 hypothetical protein SAMN06265360_106149 [Haloechinothrix alba]
MRVIRAGERVSGISDDIRAALTAFGRGQADTGGVALLGVTFPGETSLFEAVVLRPHAVHVVVGVHLQSPAMRLIAPLHGQWLADGRAVAGTDDPEDSPVVTALRDAHAALSTLSAATHATLPSGIVVAVGPYAHAITVPDAGEDGSVHVLHPSPASVRAALGGGRASPDGAARPCTIEHARAVMRLLVPDAQVLSAEQLAEEGFPAGDATSATSATSAHQAARPTPEAQDEQARPGRVGAQRLPPRRRRTRHVTWWALAGLALLLLVVLSAIGVAVATGDAETRPEPHATGDSAERNVRDVTFVPVTTSREPDCIAHTFGDAQMAVEQLTCAGILLGSFTARHDGREAAVSIAEFEFATPDDAHTFRDIVDTPGRGGAHDLATRTGRWPGEPPGFDGAVQHSDTRGSTVRVVLLAPPEHGVDGDLGRDRVLEAAADVPLGR